MPKEQNNNINNNNSEIIKKTILWRTAKSQIYLHNRHNHSNEHFRWKTIKQEDIWTSEQKEYQYHPGSK